MAEIVPGGQTSVTVTDTSNPPNLDVDLSTRNAEATQLLVKANTDNLDTTLTTLAKLIRWNRNVDPEWVHAVEQTAPGAGTVLVSRTVGAGVTGFLYGFFISAGESNDFLINWTSGAVARSIRIVFPTKGSVESIDVSPVNEGLGADAGTTVTITNVNAAGAGIIYQARLFYTEI